MGCRKRVLPWDDDHARLPANPAKAAPQGGSAAMAKKKDKKKDKKKKKK
jgi:hypothetical protein